jgi:sec-independent protein translocase protein TatA
MFAAGFGPPEIGLILVIVLVLFGGSQLPKLAKNLGKAQKEFKDGLAAGQTDPNKPTDTTKADATKSEDA